MLCLREKLPLLHRGLKSKNVKVPKEGDIVLVKDDNMPFLYPLELSLLPEDLQGWSLWRLHIYCRQEGLNSVVECTKYSRAPALLSFIIPSNTLTGHKDFDEYYR